MEQAQHQPSIDSDNDDEGDICRICRLGSEQDDPLFYPCRCSGSIKYVHKDCLSSWLQHSKRTHCEVCKHQYTFSPIYAPDAPALLPWRDLASGLGSRAATAAQYAFRVVVVAYIWLLVVPLVTSMGARLALAPSIHEALLSWDILQSWEQFTLVGQATECIQGSVLCVVIILVSVPLSSVLLHLKRGLRRLERSLMMVVVTAGHALEVSRQRQWRQQQLKHLQELQVKTNKLQVYITTAQEKRREAEAAGPEQLQQHQLMVQGTRISKLRPADLSKFPWKKLAGEADVLAVAEPQILMDRMGGSLPPSRRSARLAEAEQRQADGGSSSAGEASVSADHPSPDVSHAQGSPPEPGSIRAGAKELSRMAREGLAMQARLDALLPQDQEAREQLVRLMENTALEVMQQQLSLQMQIHVQLEQQLLQLPEPGAAVAQAPPEGGPGDVAGEEELMPEIQDVMPAVAEAGAGGGIGANVLAADAGMEDVLGLRGPWDTFAGTVGLVLFWNLSFTTFLLAMPLATGRLALQLTQTTLIPTLHLLSTATSRSETYIYASTHARAALALSTSIIKRLLLHIQPLFAALHSSFLMSWLSNFIVMFSTPQIASDMNTSLSDAANLFTATPANSSHLVTNLVADLFVPGVLSSSDLTTRMLQSSLFQLSEQTTNVNSTGLTSSAVSTTSSIAAASLSHIATALNTTIHSLASLNQSSQEPDAGNFAPAHPSTLSSYLPQQSNPSASASLSASSEFDRDLNRVWAEVASHAFLPTGQDLVALGLGYSLIAMLILFGCAAYAMTRIVRASQPTNAGQAGRRWLLRVVVRYPSLLLRPVARWLIGVVGQCFRGLKVALLMTTDLVVVPYLLGAVLEVWAGPAITPAVASPVRVVDIGERLLQGVMSTSFMRACLQWLCGICFELVLVSLKYLVRSELRVGSLPFLNDLAREPLPWRVMWETPLLRYIPALVSELFLLVAASYLVVALPLKAIVAMMPGVLPLRSTFRSSLSTAPADMLILATPLLLEQLHRRRHVFRNAVKWWLRGSATLLNWKPYLLPPPPLAHAHAPAPQPQQPQHDHQHDQHAAVGAGLANQDDGSMVHPPVEFFHQQRGYALRCCLLLVLGVGATALAAGALLVAPLVLGRAVLRLVVDEGEALGDLFALSVGGGVMCIAGSAISSLSVSLRTTPGFQEAASRALSLTVSWAKAAALLALWMGLIPLMVGRLTEQVLLPLRLPVNEHPVMSLSQDWTIGLLLVKLWQSLITRIAVPRPGTHEARWHGAMEALQRIRGIQDLEFHTTMTLVVLPMLVHLGTALTLPYVVPRLLAPLLGLRYSFLSLEANRYSHCVVIGVLVLVRLQAFLLQHLRRLHTSLRDERYLVGRQLHNFESTSVISA